MFELLTISTSDGSLAEVWVDKDAGICKKYYKPNSITVSGDMTLYKSMDLISKFFYNEIYWTTKLKSEYILETYEYGELKDCPGFYILQEYKGPDLLTYHINNTLLIEFPDIVEQLEEMFKFFQKHDVYKKNNALSNLTGSYGKIKAFDFKYAEKRTDKNKHQEINSINKWISKVDVDIKDRLLPYI